MQNLMQSFRYLPSANSRALSKKWPNPLLNLIACKLRAPAAGWLSRYAS